MPESIAAILAQAENPRHMRVATARVLLRQDLTARHDELDGELARALTADAELNRVPLGPGLADQLTALEAEIESAKVEFKFRSIGRRAWADLLAHHPPTKEQLRTAPRATFNPATFPIAAIAASCIAPELVEADVERLERALNDSQFDLLWNSCVDANLGGLTDPKSAAAGMIRRMNSRSVSSVSAAEDPSLAASSSDAS